MGGGATQGTCTELLRPWRDAAPASLPTPTPIPEACRPRFARGGTAGSAPACCFWLESPPGWKRPGRVTGTGMLPTWSGAPGHLPGSCGTQAGGSGIRPAELGSGSSGRGGRRAGLPAGGHSARVSQGWRCSPGAAGDCPGCFCQRRRAGWPRRTRTSSPRQPETAIAARRKG